jgi:hypothetical protein
MRSDRGRVDRGDRRSGQAVHRSHRSIGTQRPPGALRHRVLVAFDGGHLASSYRMEWAPNRMGDICGMSVRCASVLQVPESLSAVSWTTIHHEFWDLPGRSKAPKKMQVMAKGAKVAGKVSFQAAQAVIAMMRGMPRTATLRMRAFWGTPRTSQPTAMPAASPIRMDAKS